MDNTRHPLLEQFYQLRVGIEQLTPSLEQTAVAVKAAELAVMLDALVGAEMSNNTNGVSDINGSPPLRPIHWGDLAAALAAIKESHPWAHDVLSRHVDILLKPIAPSQRTHNP